MFFRLVRSLSSCRPFASVACLLALSIFLTGCPKDAPQPNSRIGNTERQQKTPTAMAPDAIAFNGELFRLFMLGYLSFRFAVEFIKPSDKPLAGLSAIQFACTLGAGCCVISLWRARRPGRDIVPPSPLAPIPEAD